MRATRDFYQRYHKAPKLQKRIINAKNFTYRNLISALAPLIQRAETVLDIGCGVGTLDLYLAARGKKVTGIDISERAIKVASENSRLFGLGDRIRFSVLDFPAQVPRGKFDLIVCSEVIEHLKDDRKSLRKMSNSLKGGGSLFLTVPSKNSPLYRLGFLKGFDQKVGHLRRYTRKELQSLVEEAGFKTLDTKISEGIPRNLLFTINSLGFVIRLANRFSSVSDALTFFDNLTLKLFAESQIILVAKKHKKNASSTRRSIRRR